MIALRTLFSVAFLLAAVPACSSGAPGAKHGEGEHHEAMSPAMHDFHEVLAPLWHADKGPDRVAKTCAQSAQLDDRASAVVSAAPPEGADAASWKADSASLKDATTKLVAECAKDGRADLEPRFEAVHEGFHKLMKDMHHEGPDAPH